MESIRKQQRDLSTRRMLEAAMREFALKGYSGIRLQIIAAKAGVSNGLFSQRFSGKEKLYLEAVKIALPFVLPREFTSLREAVLDVVGKMTFGYKSDIIECVFASSIFTDPDVPKSALDLINDKIKEIGLVDLIESSAKSGQIVMKYDPYFTYATFMRSVIHFCRGAVENGNVMPDASDFLKIFGFVSSDEATSKSKFEIYDESASDATKIKILQNRLDYATRMNDELMEILGSIAEFRGEGNNITDMKHMRTYTAIIAKKCMLEYPEYGLTQKIVDEITYASVLHDVGKVFIPEKLLSKSGNLSSNDFESIKKHTSFGSLIIGKLADNLGDELMKIHLDICRYHHERYDGGGYPNGLVGDEIPISAQIVSVADCLEALTHERPYRKAFSFEEAFNMIINGDCGAFSSKMINVLKKAKSELYIGYKNPYLGISSMDMDVVMPEFISGMKVLFIAEEGMERDVSIEILEKEGASVIAAPDIASATTMLSKMPSNTFDAIFLDSKISLYNLTQLNVLIKAYGAENNKIIPIIVLYSDDEKDEISVAKENGLRIYLEKPITVNKLAKSMIDSLHLEYKDLRTKLDETIVIANRDPLTGLKNLNAFTETVEKMTKEMQSEKIQFAVVECDINELKSVNDRFGHSMGDTYIRNGAGLIRRSFPNSVVYRVGGDEFITILRGIDFENRVELIKKAKKSVEKALSLPSIESGKVSFAIGMGEYDYSAGESVSMVTRKADTAMYENKRDMKSKGIFF